FALERVRLRRALLLRLHAEEHVLLLTLHHVIADGWSIGVLAGEISTLYAGSTPPLAELPVQYVDFAVWPRAQRDGERLDTLLEHGRGELAGAPAVLALPADRPRAQE